MKKSQLCLILVAIYAAPHMSATYATTLAMVFCVAGILYLMFEKE